MNKGLKTYLKKCKAKPVEPDDLEKYEKNMLNETIPQITEDIKQNQESVIELRFSLPAASRSKKPID